MRLRWMVGAIVILVTLTAAFALAPRSLPAAPPPVRLEGSLRPTTTHGGNELVVVPAPSVDIGTGPSTTTTTISSSSTTVAKPAAPAPTVGDSADDSAGSDDSAGFADDSADSAGSPDD